MINKTEKALVCLLEKKLDLLRISELLKLVGTHFFRNSGQCKSNQFIILQLSNMHLFVVLYHFKLQLFLK